MPYEQLNAAGDDASGHDRLMAAVAAYVTAITLDSDFTKANIRCFEESLKPQEKTSQFHWANSERLARLIEAGQRDGSLRGDVEARVIARMTIAAMNQSWLVALDGEFNIDHVARSRTVVDGLAVSD